MVLGEQFLDRRQGRAWGLGFVPVRIFAHGRVCGVRGRGGFVGFRGRGSLRARATAAPTATRARGSCGRFVGLRRTRVVLRAAVLGR